jgi:hypothetical protein
LGEGEGPGTVGLGIPAVVKIDPYNGQPQGLGEQGPGDGSGVNRVAKVIHGNEE